MSMSPVSTPTLPDYKSAPFDGITAQSFFAGIIRGIGQVFLADNIISCVLVLIGLTVCSRISAVAAFLGSAVGAASALAVGIPGNAVEQCMFGFNASLTVTAMFMFYTPSIGTGVLATLVGFMMVVCQQALATMLEPLDLPFMTFPFCLVGLPFIIIQGTTSIVIVVSLLSMTIPKDHLKVVQMLEDGFTFLKESLDDSDETMARRGSTRARSRKMVKSLNRLRVALSEIIMTRMSRNSLFNKKTRLLIKKNGPDSAVKVAALSLFKKLDRKKIGAMKIEDFLKILREAELVDPEGQHFARLTLDLILDIDHSTTINESEFVTFAVVGASIDTIRHKLLKLFAFFDEDGNGRVDFDEINRALEYLCQEPLTTEEECEQLLKLAEYDDDGIGVMELLKLRR
jgi:Ca2+-binding EF-hand superfamily protein